MYHQMTLSERTAHAVLAAQTNRSAFRQQCGKGQRLAGSHVESGVALDRIEARLQEVAHFWIGVDAVRHRAEGTRQFQQPLGVDASRGFYRQRGNGMTGLKD